MDVEDVFIEMWKLAPGRFSWRKYPVYPHYKIAHDALSDISKPRKGQADLLLRTPDGLARQLTVKGIEWVESRLSQFGSFARGEVRAPPDKRPSQRVLANLENSPLVHRFRLGEDLRLERHEVAGIIRCAPDSPAAVWVERLETLRSAATDSRREDLLRFLVWLEHSHHELFGGNK